MQVKETDSTIEIYMLGLINVLHNSKLAISDYRVSELAPTPTNLSLAHHRPYSVPVPVIAGQTSELLVLVLLLLALSIVARGLVDRLARAQRHSRALHIRAAGILRRNR